MQYQIQGQPYPVVVLTVEPEETVLCQKGAMAWMTPNMEMQTKGGGLGKMFSRAFTGESMFQNHYTAKGGQGMVAYDLAPGQSMMVDTGNLAAMEATCTIDVEMVKGVGNMLLGGEGLFNTKVTGPGRIWLQTLPLSGMAGALAKVMPSSK